MRGENYIMIQKTGRLKPRLYKQNPPTRVEEWAVKIILQYGLFQIVIARNEEDNTAV